MANHIFRGVHDTLLNILGTDEIEYFYIDRSKQYYNSTYDEYTSRNENEALQLVKVGNLRGLCINDPAKVLASYAEGGTGDNATEYPFARLDLTVIFKCSATDCVKLGIMRPNDTFKWDDDQEQGQNTGVVEGALNHKYIRYKEQWYRIVDLKRENDVKGESAKVSFTAEMPSEGINSELGTQYIDVIDNVETYTVYIDSDEYGNFGAGSNVTLNPPASREGYEFAGYTSNDVDILNSQFIMPSNDVYITSNWTPKYNVTIDGVIFGQYIAGTTVQIDAGTKENYTFDKWTGYDVNDEYSAQTYFTMPSQNVALETNWTQIAAKFNVYVDGVLLGQYEEGDRVDINAGTRPNYTFDEWTSTSNISFANSQSAQTYFTMINEQVNVVSHWTANFWTVQVVSSYGYDDTYTITKGQSFTLQYGTHSDESYGFDYWQINGTYTGEIPNITPTSNIIATAVWQKLGDYSVTYQGYEHTKTWHYENDTVNVAAPNKEGYDFENWRGTYIDPITQRTAYVNFNSSLVNQVNSFTMPAANVTVKATYSEWAYTVTFKVDNETYHTQQVAFAHKVSEPTAPTKEGYTFQYWKYGNARVNFNDEITEDRTYTAYFIQDIVYRTVTLYDKSSVYQTIQVQDGQTISTAIQSLPEPTHDIDERFNGWLNPITGTYLTLDTVISADTTFVSNYTQLYSVSISGMTYTTTYHASGETVNIVAESKTGKTFNEWTSNDVSFTNAQSSTTSFTMPAQNVEIVATYNDIYYTVTFYSDGAEYDEVSVIYGGTVNRPVTDPTKQYYTFNEWQDSQGNSVDFTAQIYSNQSYYADFTRDEYLMTYIVDNTTYATQIVLGGNSIGTFPTNPTPPTDYEFNSWRVNGTSINTSYIPQSDTTLTAYFTEIVTVQEISDIDLNTTPTITYAEMTFTKNLSYSAYNSHQSSGFFNGVTPVATDRNFYDLPMYIPGVKVAQYTSSAGKQRSHFDRGVRYHTSSVNPNTYFNYEPVMYEESLNTVADPTQHTGLVFFNGSLHPYNTSPDQLMLYDTILVTYSKWHYDPYDNELSKAPHAPIFTLVDNGSQYIVTAKICVMAGNRGDSTYGRKIYGYCRAVVDLGNGWYRYEWGQDSTYGIFSTTQTAFQYNPSNGDSISVLPVDPY